MKKLTIIFITLTLMLSVMIMPAHAETQTVYGQITSVSTNGYCIITDEIGTEVKAYNDDNLTLKLGEYAWYTLETRTTDKYGNYLCITGIETIPEAGSEVGYLCGYSTKWTLLYVYTDKLNEISLNSRTTINGVNSDNSGYADALTALSNYKGAVSYTLNDYGEVKQIDFLSEPKQTISEKTYNTEKKTFDGLEYNITENTDILYIKNEDGTFVNKFTGFNESYIYTFDVASYDKDKNARLVIINDMFVNGMGRYTGNIGVTEDDEEGTVIIDCNGISKALKVYDTSLLDSITKDNIVEYKYNDFDGITEITSIDSSDFTGYIYDKDNNTFGGYSLDDISLFKVEFGGRYNSIITYELLAISDKLQYSGTIYTSSFGKSILWVTGSKALSGNPIIDFWAQDSDSYLKVGATYDKNGYTGDGKIYLAVYKQRKLHKVYSYSLADDGSTYNEEYDEMTNVIYDRIYYSENDDPLLDYTVKGFVWYDNFRPMYPAVPVLE